MATQQEVEAAGTAIANARAGRRGAPAISNVLIVLKGINGGRLYDEVMEDARAALHAAEIEREKTMTKLFGPEHTFLQPQP